MACSRNLSEEDLVCFRTKYCNRVSQNKDCTFGDLRCQYSHNIPWPRRCPFILTTSDRKIKTMRYIAEMCPSIAAGTKCQAGQECEYAHTDEEKWFHPSTYKTELCDSGKKRCDFFCPNYHSKNEKRVVTKYGLPRNMRRQLQADLSSNEIYRLQQVEDEATKENQQPQTSAGTSNCDINLKTVGSQQKNGLSLLMSPPKVCESSPMDNIFVTPITTSPIDVALNHPHQNNKPIRMSNASGGVNNKCATTFGGGSFYNSNKIMMASNSERAETPSPSIPSASGNVHHNQFSIDQFPCSVEPPMLASPPGHFPLGHFPPGAMSISPQNHHHFMAGQSFLSSPFMMSPTMRSNPNTLPRLNLKQCNNTNISGGIGNHPGQLHPGQTGMQNHNFNTTFPNCNSDFSSSLSNSYSPTVTPCEVNPKSMKDGLQRYVAQLEQFNRNAMWINHTSTTSTDNNNSINGSSGPQQIGLKPNISTKEKEEFIRMFNRSCELQKSLLAKLQW